MADRDVRRSNRIHRGRGWPGGWKPSPIRVPVGSVPAVQSASNKPGPSRPLVLTTDPDAIFVPGVVVVVDPERADELGAFIEDAIGLDDVLAAAQDPE